MAGGRAPYSPAFDLRTEFIGPELDHSSSTSEESMVFDGQLGDLLPTLLSFDVVFQFTESGRQCGGSIIADGLQPLPNLLFAHARAFWLTREWWRLAICRPQQAAVQPCRQIPQQVSNSAT
jgi:hypothetical protein